MRIADWFLAFAERGNPAYRLPDWSVGNAVVPHVHGSAYFARLVDVVSALAPDDHLFFTDWRGDADERMRTGGPDDRHAAGRRGRARRGRQGSGLAQPPRQNVVRRAPTDALTRHPELHLIVIVPRHADVDGRFALPPNEVGRLETIRVVEKVAPDRVHVFDLENAADTPIYVHAKVCVVGDVWACAGSANLNRRSWSHDGELSCAVLDDMRDDREPRDPSGLGDGARRCARDLRLTLLREHLDRADGDDADLLGPDDTVRAVTAAAAALDAWHTGGRVGPRPPGRLRPHRPEKLRPWTWVWALPAYRLVYDPDGRSVRDRLRNRW